MSRRTQRTVVDRYLDLLGASLTGALLGDVNYEAWKDLKPRGWRKLVDRTVRAAGYRIVKKHPTWRVPETADTMIGRAGLDHLRECVESVLENDVPGDLIETGVWRGGACIYMRGVLAAHGVTDRRVWLADSFRGLPPPDPRYAADAGDQHHEADFLAVSADEVRERFARYSLLDDQVEFLEGWFSDTLPTAPIERLALLRLDGDMYESTIVALEALYPKLSPGGYCIVDDYQLPACRAAVHDYREQAGIDEPIEDGSFEGVHWRKQRERA